MEDNRYLKLFCDYRAASFSFSRLKPPASGLKAPF